MDEKNKNIILLVISFIAALVFGYIIMYIKSPNTIDIDSLGVVNNSKKDINFTNYLYDLDGDNKGATSVKILNDKSLYIVINNKEYSYKEFENPISVRVCHVSKSDEYNMIYILADDKIYYVKDIDFEEKINKPVKTSKNKKGKTVKLQEQIFEVLPYENIIAIAVISDYDKDTGYKYPTVYFKNKDKEVYVSKMGSEYTKLEKE